MFEFEVVKSVFTKFKFNRIVIFSLNNIKNLLQFNYRNYSKMTCKVIEITGDLFSSPSNSALAHCVAADLRMGKGIAVKFRDTFGKLGELKQQNIQPGGVAVIKDSKNDRYIYYLITKQLSYQKPTYQTLSGSLIAMKDHMNKNNVQKLSIPRIGCGLDGLVWQKVKDLINETFVNEDVQITVYNYGGK